MEPTPQHWVQERATVPAEGQMGRGAVLAAWGWSQDDPGTARSRATERLARLVERWRSGDIRDGECYYPDMPVREEVLEQVRSADGSLLAEITRNRYGARILVTDAVLIADVDLPESAGGSWAAGSASPKRSFLGRLFGRPAPEPAAESGVGSGADAAGTAPDPEEAAALERIRSAVAPHPEWDVRIQRTRAGLRVLVAGSGLQPQDEETGRLLTAMAADPLYVRLCRNQGTFRARLTAKPWRLRSVTTPRISWPAQSSAEQSASERWISGYESSLQGTQVCALREHRAGEVSEDERRVLDLHDAMTGAQRRATPIHELV